MRRLPGSFAHSVMRDVWATSSDRRANAGKPGPDGVRAQVFSSFLASNIDAVRRDIQQGHFSFGRLRTAIVPKASEGFRIIAVPNVRDRFVQRVLLRHLEQDKRFSANSPIS